MRERGENPPAPKTCFFLYRTFRGGGCSEISGSVAWKRGNPSSVLYSPRTRSLYGPSWVPRTCDRVKKWIQKSRGRRNIRRSSRFFKNGGGFFAGPGRDASRWRRHVQSKPRSSHVRVARVQLKKGRFRTIVNFTNASSFPQKKPHKNVANFEEKKEGKKGCSKIKCFWLQLSQKTPWNAVRSVKWLQNNHLD